MLRKAIRLGTLAMSVGIAHATVDQDFATASASLVRAENLEKSGATQAAVTTYSDCYAKLQRICLENPRWQNEQVDKKIAECFSNISKLQGISVYPRFRDDLNDANVLLESAENFEKSGALNFAYAEYRDSYQKFQKEKATIPPEEREQLEKKIAECRAKILAL